MRLIKPNQITGVTSTPPIGEINFLVIAKIGSVGQATKGQKPLLRLIFGYQVRIIRNKNARVNRDSKKPSNRFKKGRDWIKPEVTNFKATMKTSYKAAVNP